MIPSPPNLLWIGLSPWRLHRSTGFFCVVAGCRDLCHFRCSAAWPCSGCDAWSATRGRQKPAAAASNHRFLIFTRARVMIAHQSQASRRNAWRQLTPMYDLSAKHCLILNLGLNIPISMGLTQGTVSNSNKQLPIFRCRIWRMSGVSPLKTSWRRPANQHHLRCLQNKTPARRGLWLAYRRSGVMAPLSSAVRVQDVCCFR